LNHRYAPGEIVYALQHCAASVLIADEERQDALADVLADMPQCRRWGLSSREGWETLEAMSVRNPPVAAQRRQLEADDVAMLMFTSGTTGRPKAVQLTYRNLWSTWLNVSMEVAACRDDVVLLNSPLSHIAPWTWLALIWANAGRAVLVPRFEAGDFLRIIPQRGVTCLGTVSTLLEFVARDPAFDDADLSSLRWVVVGGSGLSPSVVQRWCDRGVAFHLAYGLTEAAGMVTMASQDAAHRDTSVCGHPLALTEVRLVDGDGTDLRGAGVTGELCIRGSNVTPGYWGEDEASFDADGWLHTGDVAQRDADGMYRIVDRLKDMVKTGGENVSAAEVERVLSEHPAVAEVAVVGVPHARWGETVVAVVAVRHGASVTLEDLRSFADGELARFKLPTRLVLMGALPRNATGKVLRHELRSQLTSTAEPESVVILESERI
jgi:fatty-acyl-CoA synthase